MLGRTGVKRRWKKMVWRMPTITDQQRHHGLSCRYVATFDNVFDVGPVGCDLESVLWRAAGVHGGGVVDWVQGIVSSVGRVTKIVVGERRVRQQWAWA